MGSGLATAGVAQSEASTAIVGRDWRIAAGIGGNVT